jgi:hypothetical protein
MKISGIAQLILQSTGEAVLEVAGRPIFSLNSVAVTIWENLAAGVSIQEITRTIVARFNVPEERAAKDLDDFIGQLRQRLLLIDDAESTTL